MLIGAVYGSGVASGSIGDKTFSHNKGGLYVRNKAIPTNPNSTQQMAIRAKMSTLVTAWTGLTDAQRDAWEAYAEGITKTNKVGASVKVSGRSIYIGNNMERLIASLPTVSAAPGSTSAAVFTAPILTCTSPTSGSLAFTNTDSWAGATTGALSLFVSRGQGSTKRFFKGPYRFATKVAGAATPPTTPATFTLPFAVTAGQKVFWRALACFTDGRISPVATGFCTAG
jgi:hypothetical protein